MKFRAIFAAAVAAFMMVPAAASAQNEAYAEVGAWSVFKNDDNCRAIGGFDGGSMLAVGYYPANDSVMLVVLDPEFTMSQDEELQYQLYLAQGENLNSDWGTVTAYGMELSDNRHGFRLNLDGNDFLEDFGANELIGFFKGDDLLISLRLEESAKIVSSLRSCAASI